MKQYGAMTGAAVVMVTITSLLMATGSASNDVINDYEDPRLVSYDGLSFSK